ncbi:MAG: ATP-dependent sacrificial sulfur transferase LarE [Lachnospiraceae bacterium]|nr:ATP-dependent sacrificial sulfur transferase LarE [Lachnospiraceae bacterium]
MTNSDAAGRDLEEKKKMLETNLQSFGSVAVAFSGGVDSAFLLKAAERVLGENVLAVTVNTYSLPERELEEAKAFCRENGIRHIVRDFDELSVRGFCENPPDRCYLCKKELLKEIMHIAKENGIMYVAEGSNVDDDGDYRPGMAAVEELGIKSPLKEAGIYKKEIRAMLKNMGLSLWKKPSFACLSSRFAYGERITKEKLAMVEQAEQFLFDRGFSQARVRIHDRMARIEVLPEYLEKLVEKKTREEVVSKLKALGFLYVSMDLEGYRTGSMNTSLSFNIYN